MPIRPSVAILALLLLATPPASAQQGGCAPAGCGDGHVALSCGGGLTILVERRARYRIVDANRDGTPEGMRLDGGAAYVDRPTGGPADFQILTPVAIASVRGTEYAVDAARGGTAVFCVSGAVNVIARGSGAGLVLRSGEGTDVAGDEPRLLARRWGQGRVDALLARFGL